MKLLGFGSTTVAQGETMRMKYLPKKSLYGGRRGLEVERSHSLMAARVGIPPVIQFFDSQSKKILIMNEITEA